MSTALQLIYMIPVGVIFVGICVFLIRQKDCEPEGFIAAFGIAAIWPVFALWYMILGALKFWDFMRKSNT